MKSRIQSLRLNLIISILVLVTAGLFFGLIAQNVVSGGAFTIVDVQIAQWLHERSTPLITQGLLIVTNLHDPIVISAISVLMTLYFIWKKHWYAVLVLVLVVQGGMLLNLLAKHVFQRARPSFENPLITLTTYSFPSGHVAASTVFYGVVAVLFISQNSSRKRAICILMMAFSMVALVAFSRIYLGAHYLSDVLAAFLEAIAWIVICLTAIQTYRHQNLK